MGNSMQAIVEILQTIFFVGMLCCLPAIIVTGIIGQFAVSMKQRKAGETLGPALGLKQFNQADNALLKWYVGAHKGRAYALQTFVVSSSYYYDGRRRNSYSTRLRIVMDTGLDKPLGVTATLNRKAKNPQRFNEAFVGEGLGLLSKPVRRAMFGFLKKGYPTGFTKTFGIRFSRGKRSINLFDWESKAKDFVGPKVLTEANTVLIFEHIDAGISPEDLRPYLDEMIEITDAIVDDVPASSLNPEQIPDESKLAQNSTLIFGLFMGLGLPAICCVCATTLVALGG
jgi:hypothetical protein